MKQFLKYSVIIAVSFAIAAPALAATLVLPTPPPTNNNTTLTASGLLNIVTQGVNYLISFATIIAVAAFIYGGFKYATGDAKGGKETLMNAAIGLLAILGVGLLINTIAALINRGLQLG